MSEKILQALERHFAQADREADAVVIFRSFVFLNGDEKEMICFMAE